MEDIVYIYEQEDNGETYPVMENDLESCASDGEGTVVGIYTLSKKVKVTKVIELKVEEV